MPIAVDFGYNSNPRYNDTKSDTGLIDTKLYNFITSEYITQDMLDLDSYYKGPQQWIQGEYTEGEVTHIIALPYVWLRYYSKAYYSISFTRNILATIKGCWSKEDRNNGYNETFSITNYIINNRVHRILVSEGKFNFISCWARNSENEEATTHLLEEYLSNDYLVSDTWSYHIFYHEYNNPNDRTIADEPGIAQLINKFKSYSNEYCKEYIEYNKSVSNDADSYMNEHNLRYHRMYRILCFSISKLIPPFTKTYTNTQWGSSKKWYIKVTISTGNLSSMLNPNKKNSITKTN